MPEPNSNALTIFGADIVEQRREAMTALVTGKTPKKYRRWRDGPWDKDTGKYTRVPYITVSHAVRQLGLLTGFRWSHRVLSKTMLPDWWKAVEAVGASKEENFTREQVVKMFERCILQVPREISVSIELTIYDGDTAYSHTATGKAEVKYKDGKPISIGNAEKGAESDAIKKAASYLGLFNDIYGPKEELED